MAAARRSSMTATGVAMSGAGEVWRLWRRGGSGARGGLGLCGTARGGRPDSFPLITLFFKFGFFSIFY